MTQKVTQKHTTSPESLV